MMANYLRTVEINGREFEFCILEEDEIKAFFHSEAERHIYGRTQEGNTMYLQFNNDDIALANVYALLDQGIIASFCIRPNYNTKVVSRLYTSPEYRNMGLATFMLDHLVITELSCVKQNHNALSLYKKLGFEIKRDGHMLYDLSREAISVNNFY